jgi:CelD/BcsL family acetyltransferase involved in cellulose biosynthesis
VIDDGAAFLPFHRQWMGVGRPVGGELSDYHGVIAAPDFQFDGPELVRAAGLQLWDFDHVPAAQAAFLPSAIKHAESPQVDLRRPEAIGSSQFREQARRRWRKLEREIGPVEFEFHCDADEMLNQCFQWKSAQYQRTGLVDVMNHSWADALIKSIFRQREDRFSGVLSVLKSGGMPVAAHFGMKSESTLHYWFPSYDTEFSIYSPGTLLLLSIIDSSRDRGVSIIDFGKGDATYKARLANAATPLMEGSVVGAGITPPAVRLCRDTAKRLVRASPLRRPVESAIRQLREALRSPSPAVSPS